MKRILIYGYGNPGRQDDGLGVSLVERLEEWCAEYLPGIVDFDSNYQLNIEDALTISEYDMVVFADASVEDISSYTVTRVEPSAKTEFTMHAMSTEFVLHLCQTLYGKFPEVYLLHLKGYEFEMKMGMTQKAEENLKAAEDFLKNALKEATDLRHFIDQFGTLFNQHTNNPQL